MSGAEVRGDQVGSEAIELTPCQVKSGDYFFDIGTAGATSLVLQTRLLPLALAPGTSSVTIHGGTHVPWSPCFHYLDWHWRPFLAQVIRLFLPVEMGMDGLLGGPANVQVRPGPADPSELTRGNGGPMFRRDLMDILKARPISLHELARLLDERPRDLEDDLEHLFRSLRKDPLCPVVTPASCRKCGLRFDQHKLHKPGKCPRCKGTWISEPLISLEEKR